MLRATGHARMAVTGMAKYFENFKHISNSQTRFGDLSCKNSKQILPVTYAIQVLTHTARAAASPLPSGYSLLARKTKRREKHAEPSNFATFVGRA